MINVYIPKSIFHGENSDRVLQYSYFFAHHCLMQALISLGVLDINKADQKDLYDIYRYFGEVQNCEYFFILSSQFLFENCDDFDIHISSSLWGCWWHNAIYPTEYLSNNKPTVLFLPFSFSFGSKSLDIYSFRLKNIDNIRLKKLTISPVDNALTSIDLYEDNRFSHYCFDSASLISEGGYRFRNDEYNNNRSGKLITILGGSSAFSITTPDCLTFPRLLSFILNEYTNNTYHVLNFGSPGATLSSLYPTLIDHILPLSPLFIISLTGFNDVRNILVNPSNSLTKSSAINDTCTDSVNSHMFDISPDTVMKESYILSRNKYEIINTLVKHHKFYHLIATQLGIEYIAAVQPISYMNVDLMSQFEKSVYSFYVKSFSNKILYQKISECLMILPKVLEQEGIKCVDFSDLNSIKQNRSALSPSASDFYDTMHQTYNLDLLIAAKFSKIIHKLDLSYSNNEGEDKLRSIINLPSRFL